jgi:hypothetical protein
MADRMRILTPDGVVEVDVEQARTRSLIGEYWNAVQYRLDTGFDSQLKRFNGMKIRGYPLETNGRAIDRWAREGEIDFEDIYAG